MKQLILIAALSALVLAKPKPETYKETEDFQYSRSSSDDGTKSGFYGAQRGNMGGNYERAHNMDNLAQHQMSGLVSQVDGDLGEGAKTRTGSVYTAANSRGIYGSGSYDLSNLQGRNFAEGESTRDSQSHLSRSSHNSRHGSQFYSGMENSNTGISSSHSHNSKYSGYQTEGHADQRQTDNLQAVDTSQGVGRYESNNQAGYNSKYHTQYGSRGHSEFDQSSANHRSSSGYDANLQNQFITTPVRVVLRPGGRVAIPITAPTYSVSQNVLPENNAINSDAEVLDQHSGLTPTNKAKHYEASYSYRKQWEKHHSIPGDALVVPYTENPYPKNSELFEDAQLLQSSKSRLQSSNSQLLNSGSMNSDHNSYSKSAESSSRSRSQSGYNSQQSQLGFDSQKSQLGLSSQQNQLGFNTQQGHSGYSSQQSSASSGTHANTYGRSSQISGLTADSTNAGGDANLKPKSYHSSYSYHKSWERQGDPYVIEPVGGTYDGQTSQRLTAASSNNAAYSSRQFGSHSRQAQQSYSADCDDQGHVRVARSYDADQVLEQAQNQWEDLGQRTQSQLENLEDLGQQQQSRWDDLQDLGQQTQNQWDNSQQQLGQETQNQWDNLEQLGQQTQNQWDNLQQLGQQTQDKWDNLEDLGQQTHRDLEQHQNGNTEDFGQQNQKDLLTNFEQQANNQNDNLELFNQNNQPEQSLSNFEQQANNQYEDLNYLSQQSQKEESLLNFEQVNYQKENIDEISQHSQKEEVLKNFEQQANNQNDNLDLFNQNNQPEQLLTNFEQVNTQNEDSLTNYEQQSNSQNENVPNPTNWDQAPDLHQLNQQYPALNTQNSGNYSSFEQNQQNLWYQSHIKKNIDLHDIMRPVSQNTGGSDKNDTQNLFPTPSNDTENNELSPQNKEQEVSWNLYESNDTYKYNDWHMNNFNDFHKQFENSFPPSSFAAGDTGNPLKNLWDKIDNIAGEFTFTEDETGEKKTISHDYSDSFSQTENGDHTQKGFGWDFMPVNPNVDILNTNIGTESETQKNSHNLFDEESQSTTVLPTLLTHYSPIPVENTSTSVNIPDQKDSKRNKNTHSQDEGRGDIGPEEISFEITTDDQQNKTPQEIETLSITKKSKIPKEEDIIVQPSSIRNKEENTDSKLLITNLTQQENINQNSQINLFSTLQPQVSTTKPILKMSTTVRSHINIHSVQVINQPISDVPDLHNTYSPIVQMNPQGTIENVEIPVNEQQHNLEQSDHIGQHNLEQSDHIGQHNLEQSDDIAQHNLEQSDDIGQHNLEQSDDIAQHNLEQSDDIGQIQSSWIPSDNLQQVHDQQNMEQQFEGFYPQVMQEQNPLQDFDQQLQSFSPQNNLQNMDVKHENPQQSEIFAIENPQQPNKLEPLHVSHIVDPSTINQNVQDNQKSENKLEPSHSSVEIITEKPGFWKSVGNKFSNAKNKVLSWFGSS